MNICRNFSMYIGVCQGVIFISTSFFCVIALTRPLQTCYTRCQTTINWRRKVRLFRRKHNGTRVERIGRSATNFFENPAFSAQSAFHPTRVSPQYFGVSASH